MFYHGIKKYRLAALLLTLCTSAANAQLNIFACEPEWAALAKALGGDAVKVYSATTAQQDPHHVQARPSLIAKVRRADILVCTGAELEVGWLPLLVRKSGNTKIQPNQPGYFMAAEQVSLLEKPEVLDRSHGDIHAAGNPHIHLDPHRLLKIASALALRLAEIDPANRAIYESQHVKFSREWEQAIVQWQAQGQALRGKRIVVNHNNWVYLEQWLGLEKAATLEPKPGIPPTSSHLSKVISGLEQNPAQMLLYASYQDDKPALWLKDKTGIAIVSLPFSPAGDESLHQWFDTLINQLLSVD